MTTGIPDFRPDDFLRTYELHDSLESMIPTGAEPDEPGTHWVARGLMAESCARLLGRPLTLDFFSRQKLVVISAGISLASTVLSTNPLDMVATVDLFLSVDSGRWALVLQNRMISIGTHLPSPAQLADEVLAAYCGRRGPQPDTCRAVTPPSHLW